MTSERPRQLDFHWMHQDEQLALHEQQQRSRANASDALIEQFCKEKMYYKERIMAMTRDLFDERCENDDINRAHEEYVKSCIEYLKWCDITEMVGEDQRS